MSSAAPPVGLFIPFTVGGGIRSLDDAAAVFDAGADKVTVNSAALADPALINRIAHRYGSQAVIVAIDALRIPDWQWNLSSGSRPPGGRRSTGKGMPWSGPSKQKNTEPAKSCSRRLTATERAAALIVNLPSRSLNAANIPVIASGGAGAAEHSVEVFRDGRADAALAASIFHLGITPIGALKQDLLAAGIPMRWPC